MPSSPKVQSSFDENAPFVLQTILLVVMITGSLLAFVGTPVLYVVYTANERSLYASRRGGSPIPIVTDMLGDWPLLGSISTGLGLTLLFTGLAATAVGRIPMDIPFSPRTTIVGYAVLAQVGAWLLLPTSRWGTGPVESWIHHGATLLLMGSSIYALYQVCQVCVAVADMLQCKWLRERAEGAKYCVYVAVAGILGATVSGGVTAFSDQDPAAAWTVLAVSELVVIGFGGVGYFIAIWAYAGIEAEASMQGASQKDCKKRIYES